MRTDHSSSRLLGGGVSASVHAGIHPLGVGLETCKACWNTTLHPWTEFFTHASENSTLPQLLCGRYKQSFGSEQNLIMKCGMSWLWNVSTKYTPELLIHCPAP